MTAFLFVAVLVALILLAGVLMNLGEVTDRLLKLGRFKSLVSDRP